MFEIEKPLQTKSDCSVQNFSNFIAMLFFFLPNFVPLKRLIIIIHVNFCFFSPPFSSSGVPPLFAYNISRLKISLVMCM